MRPARARRVRRTPRARSGTGRRRVGPAERLGRGGTFALRRPDQKRLAPARWQRHQRAARFAGTPVSDRNRRAGALFGNARGRKRSSPARDRTCEPGGRRPSVQVHAGNCLMAGSRHREVSTHGGAADASASGCVPAAVAGPTPSCTSSIQAPGPHTNGPGMHPRAPTGRWTQLLRQSCRLIAAQARDRRSLCGLRRTGAVCAARQRARRARRAGLHSGPG